MRLPTILQSPSNLATFPIVKQKKEKESNKTEQKATERKKNPST